MPIKIAHLFPYELNLYGENGNIKALVYELQKKGYKPIVINIELNAKINFKDYDFIYIGSGRPIFLEKAKKALEPYKEDIINYIKQDKILLVTGNAISIFEFLNYYEIETEPDLKIENVTATTSLCNGIIKAFQNTEYLIKTNDSIIFNLEKGYGNNNTKFEGYMKNNFYATTLIGPILARNKELTKYFINIIINNQKDRQ